jgi:hypothetical protein
VAYAARVGLYRLVGGRLQLNVLDDVPGSHGPHAVTDGKGGQSAPRFPSQLISHPPLASSRQTNASAHPGRLAAQVQARHANGVRSQREQCGRHPDQSRLAGAVGIEGAINEARRDGQVELTQGTFLALPPKTYARLSASMMGRLIDLSSHSALGAPTAP